MDIAKLRQLDGKLYDRLPPSFLRGEHLLLPNAIFHTQHPLNEVNAVNHIISHASDPLTTETICGIYSALVKGTGFEGRGLKTGPVIIADGNSEHMYVTLPADETPAEMDRVCSEYAHLDHPSDDRADDMIRFMLILQCMHPFQDGNGRLTSLVLQFLMLKAGLRCAPLLPLDFFKYGKNMKTNTMHIVYASGVFYGQKPIVFDRYIPFMSSIIENSYDCLSSAVDRFHKAFG